MTITILTVIAAFAAGYAVAEYARRRKHRGHEDSKENFAEMSRLAKVVDNRLAAHNELASAVGGLHEQLIQIQHQLQRHDQQANARFASIAGLLLDR